MKRVIVILFIFIRIFCVPNSTKAQNAPVEQLTETEIADTLNKGAMLYKISPDEAYIYGKPKFTNFIINSCKDFKEIGSKKYNIAKISAMFFGTVALVVLDQDIVDKAQQFGRYINLPGDNKAKNISPIEFVPLYVPTDIASGLYYIGDGITELSIDAGFLIYGLIKKDNRALQTASELTEGLITMGITTQVIKHLTGRETPIRATVPGGKWDWFPNLKTYQQSVPTYDAFPSGHLATAMMTVTIIANNYPEYRYIKPLGYTLMALCGYQMLNNGVHWASDYPLALAIGYTFGKMAVNRGRIKVSNNDLNNIGINVKPSYEFSPTLMQNYTLGMSFRYKF